MPNAPLLPVSPRSNSRSPSSEEVAAIKMEARSRSSKAPVLPFTFTLHKSESSAGNFNSPSSSSAFKSAVNRTRSPNRASSYSSSACAAASSSINFAHDSSTSQVQSARHPISPKIDASVKSISCAPRKRSCMCSPTNHPGTFRCSLHRNSNKYSSSTMHSQLNTRRSAMRNSPSSSTMHSHLNARRSAMGNSLLRIGGVEGEWVRRALIRPSSHHMRSRTPFQPRPSRLCHMTTAQDVC